MTADRTEPRTDEASVRAVFALSWPVMVSMLSYTCMSVIDTLFVARMGTDPLAAIGIAAVVVFTIQSFGAGLVAGVRVLVAHATGAGRLDEAHRYAWQGLWVSLVLGVALSTMSFLPPSMFEPLGATTSISMHANAFFTIRALGVPLVLINLTLSGWFQGQGDTRTPMRATVMANGLNIMLDPVFIFGLGPVPVLGTGGAALATVLSWCVSIGYLAWKARDSLLSVRSGASLRRLRALWRLGAPMGVRYFLETGSYLAFTAIIARVGAAELAAHVIVVRICMVSFLPGHAIGESCGVLVGQFVGSGREALARLVVHSALKLGCGIMAAWAVVFCMAPGMLVAPFAPEASAVNTAIQLLYIASMFQIFDAVVMVVQGALNGAGDTRFVMVSSLILAWFVKVPVGWYLALELGMGAAGAWLGFMAELVVLSGVTLIRVRGQRWLQNAAVSVSAR